MLTLETCRLLLRPFIAEDLAFLNALHADPKVARYIGYGMPRTETKNHSLMDKIFKAYEKKASGTWQCV